MNALEPGDDWAKKAFEEDGYSCSRFTGRRGMLEPEEETSNHTWIKYEILG